MHGRSGFRDTYSLGGWLFADLMLALMVLFLASNTLGSGPPVRPVLTNTPTVTATATLTPKLTPGIIIPPARPTATLTRTATPTATHTATATATSTATATVTSTPSATPTSLPCQVSVSLRKHALTVQSGPGGAGPTASQLKAAFRPFKGQRLGLLLTFGHAATPEEGESLATQVNKTLGIALPGLFTHETIREAYHWIDSVKPGSVDFNAYFFANTCGGH